MGKRLFYCGDINIEHGGFFYSLENYLHDYVDAMRCTPVSDAGGPDNLFWLEELTVTIPTKAQKLKALEDFNGETFPKDGDTRRHSIVQACINYGMYDQMSSICVQIGPLCPFSGQRETPRIKYKLRASVNLRKLVRNMALGHDLLGCVKPLTTP